MWCFETLGPLTRPRHRAPSSDAPMPARAGSHTDGLDSREDPLSKGMVVVASRPARPAQPTHVDCPFCPGGLEAPDKYDVRWFKNRWPPLPDDRCEVVLFSAGARPEPRLPQPASAGVGGLVVDREERKRSAPGRMSIMSSFSKTVARRRGHDFPSARPDLFLWLCSTGPQCRVAGDRPAPSVTSSAGRAGQGASHRCRVVASSKGGRHGRCGRLLTRTSCSLPRRASGRPRRSSPLPRRPGHRAEKVSHRPGRAV